ncbi:hypothetical protein GCM10009087_27960 [Sphingomonas oligophenolica]
MHLSTWPGRAYLLRTGQAINQKGDCILSDTNATLAELDKRIAIIEDNLRDLVEQAAAYSGSNHEERSSDRIAEQQQELDSLKKQRDALS